MSNIILDKRVFNVNHVVGVDGVSLVRPLKRKPVIKGVVPIDIGTDDDLAYRIDVAGREFAYTGFYGDSNETHTLKNKLPSFPASNKWGYMRRGKKIHFYLNNKEMEYIIDEAKLIYSDTVSIEGVEYLVVMTERLLLKLKLNK